ncbi:hypothetical protein K3495_g2369 [Podosphaera aphanis]|nr:hypothetical protein K3495_g2369 [Podosphaera aphanis]
MGMDFTGPVIHGTFSSYLFIAIEYVTSLGIALLVNSTDTSGIIALFNLISISFDPPKELIVDNGSAFVIVELKFIGLIMGRLYVQQSHIDPWLIEK